MAAGGACEAVFGPTSDVTQRTSDSVGFSAAETDSSCVGDAPWQSVVARLTTSRGGVRGGGGWRWTEFSGLINKQGLCPLIFALPHRKERAGDTEPVVV